MFTKVFAAFIFEIKHKLHILITIDYNKLWFHGICLTRSILTNVDKSVVVDINKQYLFLQRTSIKIF